jgi:GNAT superfamily N-acetyltransferase
MSETLPSLDPFTLDQQIAFMQAYESNAAAYALALAEAGGGLALHEPDFALALFPYPHPINGVFLPRFKPENCDQRIEMILEIASQRQVKIRFRLGPSPQPADLAGRLERRGVRRSVTQRLMALHLREDSPLLSASAQASAPEGLRIYPIEDYQLLLRMTHPRLGRINTPRKRCLLQAYQKLAEERPRRHWTFVAELEGRLVGSVGVFFHQDSIAGYDLLVLKEHRRQGIGAAMLRHIGRFALGYGATQAVLATSVQGKRFYPRLGIAPVGDFPVYTFEP